MDIDPIQYGQLISKVEFLEREVSDMRSDVKKLLELANQSKGGLWMGMALASLAGAVLQFIGEKMFK
jgi:hypothetical protein